MTAVERSWHVPRLTVYLDQWVWIRLSRAAVHRPERPEDRVVLSAVRDAAESGVIFPLSATHYEETLRILDPRQRDGLVAVMAPISSLWAMRSQPDLVRHQILTALHESVGRPTFRPSPLRVLGLGVSWAFRGVEARLLVRDPGGEIVTVDGSWLRRANQYFEALQLAGPDDEDEAELRLTGYRSVREIEDAPRSRLAWEELFADRLTAHSPRPDELRQWVLGRELIHEYGRLLTEILSEYRLSLRDIAGSSEGPEARLRMTRFVERIPTLRIAAEVKALLFRNRQRKWSHNMVRDIDAASIAVPYCHVAVLDRDAAALVRRTGADTRHQTTVTADLAALPQLLDELCQSPTRREPASSVWDAIGPGDGFALTWPGSISESGAPPGSTVSLSDPDGHSTTARISEQMHFDAKSERIRN